jgi:uroporphyrinogen decarboxylase
MNEICKGGMNAMTHRERFIAAAARRRPDRAVYDLSGSPQTNVDFPETASEIARLLGISGEKQGKYNLDERILSRLDIDTRRIGGMPTPQTSHNRTEGDVFYDSYGIGYKDMGNRWEIVVNPLRDTDIDGIRSYEFPDPANIDRRMIGSWAEQAEHLHKNSSYAVVAEHPVLGVFELGCWMFGFDDYLYRLAAEPETVHVFSEIILGYQKKVIEIYYGALGKYITCTTSGDDFGMQTGPFMSVGMFDELIKPYLKERISYTKTFTDAFYKHHTCGSVHSLIPSLIDCGVDILNPIQPNTYMMEPERLKADYGGTISFWGGIDTQRILPEGSADDVKSEVKRILAIMGSDGGYILAPAHTIQNDVPAANVIAIYDGAMDYYQGINNIKGGRYEP